MPYNVLLQRLTTNFLLKKSSKHYINYNFVLAEFQNIRLTTQKCKILITQHFFKLDRI